MAVPSLDDSFDRRARILVCEDSPTRLKFLQWLLQPLYEVCLASSGERAIAAAVEFLPDLVLCDLMLPGISGTEVYRRLRALPAFEDVPFVVMTALDDEDSRALGLEAGADDYLRKPVNERELLARVASLVRLRRVTASLRAQNSYLSRSVRDGSGGGMDPARRIRELEMRQRRCALAACAVESPVAGLEACLKGVAAALASADGVSKGALELALGALDGAMGAGDRIRASLRELEQLLEVAEPAGLSDAARSKPDHEDGVTSA
jgi:DNA-binding response OmpR family regulator